jgi:hypothetical protein
MAFVGEFDAVFTGVAEDGDEASGSGEEAQDYAIPSSGIITGAVAFVSQGRSGKVKSQLVLWQWKGRPHRPTRIAVFRNRFMSWRKATYFAFAVFIGISDHSLAHVLRAGILKKLGGRAASNNCGVWLSSVAVIRVAESEEMMSRVTEAIIKGNRFKNAEARAEGENPELN